MRDVDRFAQGGPDRTDPGLVDARGGGLADFGMDPCCQGRRIDPDLVPIEGSVVVTPEQAEAILRITGEALRNAARHGGASCVSVALEAEPLVLTVSDDGCGFHPDEVVSRGFGLTSMRERAEGAGASYALASTVGRGTEVRVSWT